MIGALAFTLLMLILGWIRGGRSRMPTRTRLDLTVPTLWVLDHICVSLGGLLREWPELCEVRLSVAPLATIDAASMDLLKGAIRIASTARVRFRLDDYNVSMARLAIANGIGREHLGRQRTRDKPCVALH